MTGHLTEIITLGVLAFAVVYGVLELLWELWAGRKPAAGNHTD